jgi:hypothetical protein
MSFQAKYAGYCNAEDCSYGDTQIRPGDQVEYLDDQLMHVECAAHQRRGHGPLCPNCFQEHRGECL